MPTRQCPNGHLTRDGSALFCPMCGAPMSGQSAGAPPPPPQKKRSRGGCVLLGILGGIFLLFVYVASQGGSSTSGSRARATATMSPELVKRQAQSIAYDSLARDTESYVGNIVHYRGKVVQVQESGSRAVLRVNVTNDDGWWEDTVWVNYSGPRLLEDDIISLWGRVRGRRTYTAVLGNSITIPELDALIVER